MKWAKLLLRTIAVFTVTVCVSSNAWSESAGSLMKIDDRARFLSDLDLSFQFKGLEKNMEYKITAAFPHTKDASRVFLTSIEAKSDKDGNLDFGRAIAEKKLGRLLVDPEPRYAGALALKLFDDVSAMDVPAEASDLVARLPAPTALKPLLLAKASKVGGTTSVPWSMEIYRYDPSMQSIPLKSAVVGFDGVFTYANRPDDRAVVVLAGGGSAVSDAAWANYIAHSGFHVLQLYGLSQSEGVNPSVERFPLDLFEKAIAYVRAQPFVNGQDVSVMGDTRGAEAALLVAQLMGNDLKVKRVFAFRPHFFVGSSRMSGSALLAANPLDEEHSSWTYHGAELAFAQYPVKDKSPVGVGLDFAKENGTLDFLANNGVKIPAMRMLPGFQVITPTEQSLIHLQDYVGHVYAIAGEDDGFWRAPESVGKLSQQRTAKLDELRWTIKGAGHTAYPGAMPEALGDKAGILTGAATEAEVAAGNSVFLLSGGKQLNNAVATILNQFQVYCAMKNYEPEQIPFADFLKK